MLISFGGRPLAGRPLFHVRRTLLAVLLAAGTTACSTPEPRGPVVTLLETRHRNVIIQQWDLSCGAAALGTLLAYQHNNPVPEKVIAESMLRRVDPLKFRVRGGFSLLDLKRFADGRGYEGSGYGKLTLDSLVKLAPAIVPIQARDFKHFVVFRGIRHGRVLLADPAFGNRTMTTSRFEDAWVEKVAFTVERKDDTVPLNYLAPDNQTLLLPPDSFIRTQWR